MIISELIKQLESIKNERGDLVVATINMEYSSLQYCMGAHYTNMSDCEFIIDQFESLPNDVAVVR